MAGKPEPLVWRKSLRCSASACVEVAAGSEFVYVRDARARGLTFGREPWRSFIAGLKAGHCQR